MENKRISWIDWIKTLCIFCMVCRHSDYVTAGIIHAIQPFYMSSFFLISGYLFKNPTRSKILLSIIIPFLFYSLFVFVDRIIRLGVSGAIETTCFFQLFQSQPGGIFTGVWFLWALLLSELVMSYCINKGKAVGIVMCVCILWNVCIPLWPHKINDLILTRVFQSFPLFVCGNWYRKYEQKIRISAKIYIVLLVFALLSYIIVSNNEMYNASYSYGYLVFFVQSVLFFFVLRKSFENFPKQDFVEAISKGTFLVLGVHIVLLQYLQIFVIGNLCDYWPFVCSIFILLVSYPIIILFSYYCPCLLGKIQFSI